MSEPAVIDTIEEIEQRISSVTGVVKPRAVAKEIHDLQVGIAGLTTLYDAMMTELRRLKR